MRKGRDVTMVSEEMVEVDSDHNIVEGLEKEGKINER